MFMRWRAGVSVCEDGNEDGGIVWGCILEGTVVDQVEVGGYGMREEKREEERRDAST